MNLVPAPGDTAALVSAREAFRPATSYRRRRSCGGDAGSRPAHHLAATGADLPFAVDAPPPRCAALRDAQQPPSAATLEAPATALRTWPTPSERHSPRNGAEFARSCDPAGSRSRSPRRPFTWPSWSSTRAQLSVDPDKEERLQASCRAVRAVVPRERHERALELAHADALAAARMGPSAWHLHPGELVGRESVLPEPLAVTAAVDVTEWSSGPR